MVRATAQHQFFFIMLTLIVTGTSTLGWVGISDSMLMVPRTLSFGASVSLAMISYFPFSFGTNSTFNSLIELVGLCNSNALPGTVEVAINFRVLNSCALSFFRNSGSETLKYAESGFNAISPKTRPYTKMDADGC